MRTVRRFPVWLAAGAVLLLGACDSAAAPTPDEEPAPALEPMPPFDTAEVTLEGPDGDEVALPVYVADDDAKRRQGLMGVTDLPDDAGMVFVYTEDSRGGFWMKNTLIPLSIAFFDADGEIVRVLDMEPCEADPCPTYDPGAAYRGALEVNEGTFDRLGLDDDWRIAVPRGVWP